MLSPISIVQYIFAFLALYAQVFLLLNFIERRKELRPTKKTLIRFPKVTIIVPCFNEEKTLYGTIQSILALRYPKNKLHIIIVDDGSTDNTWNVAKRLAKHPRISVFKKENGGKHTALNFALTKTTTPYVGCLDADSRVHPAALINIMNTFHGDKTLSAVVPSIVAAPPKNLLQRAQKAEYDFSIYTKKMVSFMDGIHVTPGPFSIFKKKVFDDLGPYRKAHNTEDQEIALRMQEHGLRIAHCHDAYVYTNTPTTPYKLYRQRLRWTYGFLKNAIDYRRLFFRKKYGNVGTFTLPSGVIALASVVVLISLLFYRVVQFTIEKIIQFQVAGFSSFSLLPSFDWFFLNTKTIVFVSVLLIGMTLLASIVGRKMAGYRRGLSLDLPIFIIFYAFLAPLWMGKAFINTIRSKESSWTAERQ